MESFKVNCVLVGTILLWASAFVGIRIGLIDYSPGALALLRFLIASLCMAIIYSTRRITKTVIWKDRIQLMLVGAAGIGIYNICLNIGEVTISAGIASFIMGLMPVITIILSLFFLEEKLNPKSWYGIVISVIGLFVIAIGEDPGGGIKTGIFMVLISVFMGSVLNIAQKRFLSRYHPVAITSWIMWGGTLFLLIFLPDLVKEIKQASYYPTAAIIYMGIFPAAFAYLGWNYALNKINASKAALALYALPLASTVLGFLILHERPSLISIGGGSISILGALIANRFQSRPIEESSLDEKVVAV